MAICKNINIVRYKQAFVDNCNLCIIMEYCNEGFYKIIIRFINKIKRERKKYIRILYINLINTKQQVICKRKLIINKEFTLI